MDEILEQIPVELNKVSITNIIRILLPLVKQCKIGMDWQKIARLAQDHHSKLRAFVGGGWPMLLFGVTRLRSK